MGSNDCPPPMEPNVRVPAGGEPQALPARSGLATGGVCTASATPLVPEGCAIPKAVADYMRRCETGRAIAMGDAAHIALSAFAATFRHGWRAGYSAAAAGNTEEQLERDLQVAEEQIARKSARRYVIEVHALWRSGRGRFERPGRAGYTDRLEEAGRWSLDEVRKCMGRGLCEPVDDYGARRAVREDMVDAPWGTSIPEEG